MKFFFIVLIVIFAIQSFLFAGSRPKTSETGAIKAFLDTTMLIQDDGQKEFREEFKKLTGVSLEIIQPAHQEYNEKLFIQLASGDLPDILEVQASNLSRLVTDGVVISLEKYIKSAKNMDSIYPHFMNAVKYKDGHVYGIQTRNGGGCVSYIRKDWLDKLGLSMPKTWNDFVEVLRAFTFDDPDGNGANDTFGYTEPLGVSGSDWDWYNRPIMLEARIDLYFNGDKWVDGFQEPGMVKALERYRGLYKAGVIDTEFFTNKTSTARSKLYNGQVGVFTYWANHWAKNLWERAKSSVGPGAEVVPMPAIEGQTYIRRVAPLLVITVGAKDPAEVFTNFIDKQYDKGAVQELFTYGKKGYHWRMKDDGSAEFLPNPNDPKKAPFKRAYVPPMDIQNDWDQPMPVDPIVVPALEIFNKYSKQDPLRSGGKYYSKYYSEIASSLKPEIFAKIVIGEYTIEEGIAIYKEKIEALHLDDILDEMNE